MVLGVGVTIVTRGVVLQPAQDDRAARTAAGRGAEGIAKPRALLRQLVKRGGPDIRIAIAPRILTHVISNKEDDVPRHRHEAGHRQPKDAEDEDQTLEGTHRVSSP